jgi:MOSC domain-containing protein YiiM
VLHARHDSRAGIYASIVTAGVVRLGDLLNVSLIS